MRHGFLLILVALCSAGCSTKAPKLDTTYGKAYGTPGQKSVNGTSVLKQMFADSGSNVTTTVRFSPRLEKVDTIVWFPNDFDPPTLKHREYLERWLSDSPGRTVVYVGRDYNASVDYWRQATPYAKPEQSAEYHRKLAEAISEWNTERMKIPGDTYNRWFMLRAGKPPRVVKQLEGPWSSGIDPTKCDIKLATRFDIPTDKDRPTGEYQQLCEYEALLTSQKEPLVTLVTAPAWYDSRVIVVTNGSFLLNLPLVNKEHRKLAGKLIEETSGIDVAFVESDAGGPPIRERDDKVGPRTGFEMLSVFPLNVLLLHVLGWLLLVCICLFPIFGRPRLIYGVFARGVRHMSSPLAHLLLAIPAEEGDEEATRSTGDFGRHLTALGNMLSLTGDRAYAAEKLRYYHQHIKRDSGVSHVSGATKKPTTPLP